MKSCVLNKQMASLVLLTIMRCLHNRMDRRMGRSSPALMRELQCTKISRGLSHPLWAGQLRRCKAFSTLMTDGDLQWLEVSTRLLHPGFDEIILSLAIILYYTMLLLDHGDGILPYFFKR